MVGAEHGAALHGEEAQGVDRAGAGTGGRNCGKIFHRPRPKHNPDTRLSVADVRLLFMATRGHQSGRDVEGGKDAGQRAIRLAFLRTLHDLRLSVAAGRPMTLPNCLRLCRRRLETIGDTGAAAIIVGRLAALYRQHQPFAAGPHVIRSRRER